MPARSASLARCVLCLRVAAGHVRFNNGESVDKKTGKEPIHYVVANASYPFIDSVSIVPVTGAAKGGKGPE